MLLPIFLLALFFECVLLSVLCFSGRGMALSFLLFLPAVLPLLSESAYNTSAGNDYAVYHKCLSLTQCLQLSVQNNCGCFGTIHAVWAHCLLPWCLVFSILSYQFLIVRMHFDARSVLYDNRMSPVVQRFCWSHVLQTISCQLNYIPLIQQPIVYPPTWRW